MNQGVFSRQRHAGNAQRQRHFGSVQRHLAEPGSHLGEHGHELALDRARGIQPVDGLRRLQQPGLTHTAGTTLTVPAGQGFGGSGSISDPVNCQGTITAASGGTINLSGGLTLSGTGTVNLGSGNLTSNDLDVRDQRRIAFRREPVRGQRRHGDLHAVRRDQQYQQLISISATTPATAARTTSAAAASCRHPTSTWAYSGTGSLHAVRRDQQYQSNGYLYLGYERRQQRHVQPQRQRPVVGEPSDVRGLCRHGDLHTVRRDQQRSALVSIFGMNAGGSGTYNLSGSGQLSAYDEYVGYSGTGTFTQSGGTNSIGSYLYLGNERRQQRHIQPQRQQLVGILRVRGLLRHGDLHAVRRDQQYQQLFVSRLQRRQQRYV